MKGINSNLIVSIIIPIFNRGELLLRTLESVENQTYNNWECLLIDDRSTDNTLAIVEDFIEKDDRFKVYLRPANKLKGPSSCRNIGIEKAKGDFMLFLDSDDELVSSCLKNRISFAELTPGFDVWVFKMRSLHSNGKLGDLCNFYPDDIQNQLAYLKLFLSFSFPFTVTCPLWKTKALKSIQGFDERLIRFEDPELHIRALAKGLRFTFDTQSEADCYYYKDSGYKEKFENKKLLSIIYSNYYSLLECMIATSFSNITYDEIILLIRKNFILFLNGYYTESRKNFKELKKIIRLLKKNRILTSFMYWSIYSFFGLVELGYSKSNRGFYKVKSSIYKKISNS